MKMTKMNTAEKLLTEDYLHLVPIMVSSLTRSYSGLSIDELDELKQIGYLALCEAAQKYDGKRSFKPYANAAIRNAIYDHWRGTRRHQENFCSLDAMTTGNEDTSYEKFFAPLSYITPEQEHAHHELIEYLTKLSNQSCHMIQKGILSLRLQQNGYTSVDLAELFQVPPNRIRAWQSKARAVLKKNQTLYSLLVS